MPAGRMASPGPRTWARPRVDHVAEGNMAAARGFRRKIKGFTIPTQRRMQKNDQVHALTF